MLLRECLALLHQSLVALRQMLLQRQCTDIDVTLGDESLFASLDDPAQFARQVLNNPACQPDKPSKPTKTNKPAKTHIASKPTKPTNSKTHLASNPANPANPANAFQPANPVQTTNQPGGANNQTNPADPANPADLVQPTNQPGGANQTKQKFTSFIVVRARNMAGCKMWFVYCFPGIMLCEKSTNVHIMRDALEVVQHELVNQPDQPNQPDQNQPDQPNQPNQPDQPDQPAELVLINYSGCTPDAAKLVSAFKAKFAKQIVVIELSLDDLQVNTMLHPDQPVQIRRLTAEQAKQVKFREPITLNVLPSTDPAVILAGGFAGQCLEVTRNLPTGVKDVCLFKVI